MGASEQQINTMNEQVKELPVIRNLQIKTEKLEETDKILYAELEKLENGQVGINERLDKGSQRMDGIEDELKSLRETLRDGLKEVIVEIKDTKISELKKDLSDRKSSDNGLRNDLIRVGVVAVLAVLGYLFIKSYG